MPLPQTSTAWPPDSTAALSPKWAEWAAWWSDDTQALADIYGGSAYRGTSAAQRTGLVAAISRIGRRMFWGESRTDLTRPAPRKMHVPVAGDLCRASADMLLAEPPAVTVAGADKDDTARATQDRVVQYLDADFMSALVSGAEAGAALGGTYLRVAWDRAANPDAPFLTVVDYDAAVPEFRWGRLTAVTFWHVVRRDGPMVWRHLERHETDPTTGNGVIVHGLYQGTEHDLGTPRPLEEHPATEALAAEVDADSKIDTLTPGLAAIHWPNTTPNRSWRSHAVGRHLGRSDLDGLEGLLDALDETYTSLMRDVNLGKAMLVVPRTMVTDNGPGRGMSFDQNEIYSPVNVAPSTAADSSMPIEQVQFDIRVQEHEQTIALLWNALIRAAGFSAQTFGEGDSTATTATEVQARERRSSLSKARKARTMSAAISRALSKMVAIDAAVFGTPNLDPLAPIEVEVADGFQEGMEYLAGVASALRTGLAASVRTRVQIIHPDWSPQEIDVEVARIYAEEGLAPLMDPDTVGTDGQDLSDGFAPDAAPDEGEADL